MKEDVMFTQLKKELPGLQKNVLLKDYTTFNIGGLAEYFYIASDKEQLIKAISTAKQLNVPVFVLSGGSNLLVADEGIRGLIIKLASESGIELNGEEITAPAGVSLGALVDFSIEHSLQGLEWAAGLPGSFGGAIRGNAGAFGGEIKDSIIKVEALDDTLTLRTFDNQSSDFSYRNSIFKQKNWLVVSATVKLKMGDKNSLQELAESKRQYRKEKHPLEYPSAGSVFKNVDVKDIPAEFIDSFRDKIKQDPFPIVPAAWFIIGAGLTGRQIGKAQISPKHSNYIVNLGGATAKDVLDLAFLVERTVKEKYDIDLEMEVQYIKN